VSCIFPFFLEVHQFPGIRSFIEVELSLQYLLMVAGKISSLTLHLDFRHYIAIICITIVLTDVLTFITQSAPRLSKSAYSVKFNVKQ